MNPFATQNLGLIDFVFSRSRLTKFGVPLRVAIEVSVILALAIVVVIGLSNFSTISKRLALEIGIAAALFFSSIRPLFIFCRFLWLRPATRNEGVAAIVGFIFACVCFETMIVPRILITRWTGDYLPLGIAAALGGASMVGAISVFLGAAMTLFLLHCVREAERESKPR